MGLRTHLGNSQDQSLFEVLHLLDGTRGLYGNADLHTQFSIRSYIGVSNLRDRVIEDGSAVTDAKDSTRVVNTLGEYEVTCPAAGSVTELLTAQFGRYEPGFTSVAGAGVRVPSQPSGDARIEWGFGNEQNAAGSENRIVFGQDADGVYVRIDRDGTEVIKTYQQDWNLDKLDGSGPNKQSNPSGITLDVTRGNVYHVAYRWYGYGDIVWVVEVPDSLGVQHKIPIHAFSPDGETSVAVPDAPVGILVDIGTTGTEHKAFIAGRTYGTIGGTQFPPITRLTPEERINASVPDGAWFPLIATRRKAAADQATINIFPERLSVTTDSDILIALFVGNDPTNGTFADAPTDGDSGETTLQWNNDADNTGFTPGLPIWKDIVPSGAGSASREGGTASALRRSVPDREPLILAAKGLGSVATVSATLNMEEGW